MTDFRPSGQKPPRRGLTRTAPFRVGLVAFFCLPILPEGVRNRRVLRYQRYSIISEVSSVGTYGREEGPLPDGLLYSVHYHIRFFAVWQADSSYISVFFRKTRKFLCFKACFHTENG